MNDMVDQLTAIRVELMKHPERYRPFELGQITGLSMAIVEICRTIMNDGKYKEM